MQDQIPNEICPETNKPIVYFSGQPEFRTINNGDVQWEFAIVQTLNHPILGRDRVCTSHVVRKFQFGFETLNTIYMMDDSGWGG